MIQRIAKHWETNLITVFLLGFSSGLPFLMILSTLSVWLSEVGVSKTLIGLFAWVSIPYSIKFLWGAMVDNVRLPWLTQYFGVRRGWLLLSQICLWISLIVLGMTEPMDNLWMTAFCALLVGSSSAIQDIVIEAYRIEILPAAKVGIGASASVLGYRVGMLCAGAGTIYLAAEFNSWHLAYNLIAACMALGIITTLFCREPTVNRSPTKMVVFKALKIFLRKLDWQIIIPFILSYKIADTVLNVMSMPFLLEIGFNKVEIASVARTFGISAMIVGGFVGGILLMWQSLRDNLMVCVALQAFASALFIMQAQYGHDVSFLFVTMGVENFTCGMSQVALIAYLSQLCPNRHTALYYGILSSFASFVRVSFSALAGWLADHYAWSQFYTFVCISCVPSVILLIVYAQHFVKLSVVKVANIIPAEPQESVEVTNVIPAEPHQSVAQ